MRRARYQRGTVNADPRTRKLYFRWYEKSGKRRAEYVGDLSSPKRLVEAPAVAIRCCINAGEPEQIARVSSLVERWKREKMSDRFSTSRSDQSRLRNHILPKWGDLPICEVRPREAELWLKQLRLSGKSRAHLKNLLSRLYDYAMFVEEIPVGRNPMQLVQIKGVSRRTREIRILTWEEFSRLQRELEEPFCTMAIVAACCGLRVSEFLALKWDDVDWLGRRLRVERAIVMQHLGDCKTIGSQKNLPLADEVLAILRGWREQSAFTNPEHFIFASPVQIGRLPWSYPHVMRVLKAAATRAGIDRIGTHTFRHSFRSWLDAIGTPIALQQKLMRHSDIRTTMNIYGDVMPGEMRKAHDSLAQKVLKPA